jgi:hypothetical protein
VVECLPGKGEVLSSQPYYSPTPYPYPYQTNTDAVAPLTTKYIRTYEMKANLLGMC